MKALTICQPWASAIMTGIKKVENRKWRTNYTGPLAIHAGQSKEWYNWIEPDHPLCPLLRPLQPWDKLPFGAILGVVELISADSIEDYNGDCPFAFGPYCWIIENPRQFKKPIPWRGRQVLWNVPDYVLERKL